MSKIGPGTSYLLLSFLSFVFSCTLKTEISLDGSKPTHIVLISEMAPAPYHHYFSQDTLGRFHANKTGPYSPIPSPGFTYLNDQGHVRVWTPEIGAFDTIVIPCSGQHLELKTKNYFALLPTTFLLEAGDTVILSYPDRLPVARIINRAGHDAELNYCNYRLKLLFHNSLSSHRKVQLGILLDEDLSFDETTIKYYLTSLKDLDREQMLLDALYAESAISSSGFNYRKNTLAGLRKEHLKNRAVSEYVKKNVFISDGALPNSVRFDLSKTDSLMIFSDFREHLKSMSNYNLPLITHDRGNSGSAFFDSRIRFDSISEDPRFNQMARDFLLEDAFL